MKYVQLWFKSYSARLAQVYILKHRENFQEEFQTTESQMSCCSIAFFYVCVCIYIYVGCTIADHRTFFLVLLTCRIFKYFLDKDNNKRFSVRNLNSLQLQITFSSLRMCIMHIHARLRNLSIFDGEWLSCFCKENAEYK